MDRDKQPSLTDTFKELAEIAGKYWAEIDDIEVYLHELRHDDDEVIDANTFPNVNKNYDNSHTERQRENAG